MFPISLSEEVYKRLTMTWGPEVILRCKCTDWPSHSMFGQKGSGRCGSCHQVTQMIPYRWSITDG